MVTIVLCSNAFLVESGSHYIADPGYVGRAGIKN